MFYITNTTNNVSKLLLKNTSKYTVEHDFFGTARWRNLFLVLGDGVYIK